jgi:hypothetical protein
MKEHPRMITSSAAEGLVSSPNRANSYPDIDLTPSRDRTKAEAQAARAARAVQVRQASQRRRLVDPTTCEREYSLAEVEFMNAIQAYKQSSGRMFPTWSEVLEVLKGLGYEKTV